MRFPKHIYFLFVFFLMAIISVTDSGCANIGQPTGGPRDSLAPVLEKANPPQKSVDVTSNRFTFVFDEYVEVADAQTNVIVSPLQNQTPQIRSNFRTVSVKLRDSLQPNTTYTIDFGDAVKDLNEGNVLKNFSYTFSTGKYLDSLSFSGKVLLAETGLIDTTLQVYLYQNAPDSAVLTQKPKYITRLNGVGEFNFTNLPHGTFHVYVLKDGDGGKTYNGKAELFAFLPDNKPIKLQDSTPSVTLYAYAEEQLAPVGQNTAPTGNGDKKNVLRITTSASPKQDILNPLEVYFTNPLVDLAPNSLVLTDTNFRPVANAAAVLDSTHRIAKLNPKWNYGQDYFLLINKAGIKDSLGNNLFKSDTLKFTAKNQEDYGKIVLRFTNLDLKKHPVLQLLQNNAIKINYTLTSDTWRNDLFPPGEYTIRILYDENGNGKWDPGNFKLYKQPEKAITYPQKLAIRADWENERDITL